MKNIMLLSLGIILGVSITWVVKPMAVTPTAEPASSVSVPQKERSLTSRRSHKSTPAITASSRETKTKPKFSIVTSGLGDSDLGNDEEVKEKMEKWQAALKERQGARFEARLAKLTKELNLSPAQVAQLRGVWEDKVAALGEGRKAYRKMRKLDELLKGDGLDDSLASILEEEQNEQYEDLKEQEFHNKVESIALNNLSKLSFLNLRPEQKDTVLEILYNQAEAEAQTEAPTNSEVTIMDGSGGVVEFSTFFAGPSIDERVDALAPVLDQEQLDEYRTSLETR